MNALKIPLECGSKTTKLKYFHHIISDQRRGTRKMKVTSKDKADYYIMWRDRGLTHEDALKKTFEWVYWLERN